MKQHTRLFILHWLWRTHWHKLDCYKSVDLPRAISTLHQPLIVSVVSLVDCQVSRDVSQGRGMCHKEHRAEGLELSRAMSPVFFPAPQWLANVHTASPQIVAAYWFTCINVW